MKKSSHARRFETSNRECGAALVSALLFALVAAAYVAAIVSADLAVSGQARAHQGAREAHAAAGSGINYAVALMSQPNRQEFLDTVPVGQTLRGTGAHSTRFQVNLTSALADGADNDLDGLIDEADEAEMYEAVSIGSYDGMTRAVRATLLARFATPQMPSAVYVHDPMAGVTLNGNAFRISGQDVDMAGRRTGSTVPGIGVNGSPTSIITELQSQHSQNVTGSGGTPSVAQVAPLDLAPLIAQGARTANVVLEEGVSNEPENPGDWGTEKAPAVVYGVGDIRISGQPKGFGILVIDGNLTLSGKFTWHGLIVVKGSVTISGGGGNKNIIGGLVVDQGVSIEEDPEVTVQGSVDIDYSGATIEHVRRTFAIYQVMNWREGPAQ